MTSSTNSSSSSNETSNNTTQNECVEISKPTQNTNLQINQQINVMLDNWIMGVPHAQSVHMKAITELISLKKSNKTKRKRKYINREREEGAIRLWKDYFAPAIERTYSDVRFRMRRHVFLRIVEDLTNNDPWFMQQYDACGKMGLTQLQKFTAAMRVLAYGSSYDQVDEYVRMGASTVKECLTHFVDGVISVYSNTYLRAPNPEDLKRLLHAGEKRGFPGMLGSIDCMHWEWKNCPMAWKGQFTGRDGKSTIILEAVASYDLWIWHSFFGVPGSCNDINVLDRSPLFNDVMEGRAPPVQFDVNGHSYDMGYYLTDGIYPQWATFVPSIRIPRDPKAKLFSQLQESHRKDVERAFGVLQARFNIIRNPSLIWDIDLVRKIMTVCIILHNIIVEDERDTYKTYYDIAQFETSSEGVHWQYDKTRRAEFSDYLKKRFQIRQTETHQKLKEDLVEHIWQKYRG